MKLIIAFTATWCGPCKQLKPTINEIAEEYQVEHVDIDENPKAVKLWNIQSVPTLVFVSDVKNDVEAGRLVSPNSAQLKDAAAKFFA